MVKNYYKTEKKKGEIPGRWGHRQREVVILED